MQNDYFDVSFFAKIWKTGDSYVITIKSSTIQGLNLQEGEEVYIHLKKIKK